MANEVDNRIKEMQERQRLLEAQAALAEAEKKLATARNQLAAEQRNTGPSEQDRRKAEAETAEAVAKAEKAAAEARKESSLAAAAAIGTIPANTVASGSATFKASEKPPQGEAVLLQHKALGEAARQIALQVQSKCKSGGTIGLVGARMLPRLVELERRRFALAALITNAANLDLRSEELNAAGDALLNRKPRTTTPATTESLAAIGSMLSSISGVASYFKTDYEYWSGVDDASTSLLATAVAGELLNSCPDTKVVDFDTTPHPEAPVVIQGVLQRLNELGNDLDANRRDLLSVRTDVEQWRDAPANAASKAEAIALLADMTAFETSAQVWETERKAFIDAVGTDAVLGPLVSDISVHLHAGNRFIEKTLNLKQELDPTGYHWLTVQAHKAVSSAYSKRNLWTTLGGPLPYWVAGGVTASWALFDSQRQLKGAGLIPVHGGFWRVTDVPAAVRPSRN